MENYIKTKSAHQYYRDVFSREIMLGGIGDLPKDIIIELIVKKSCDLYALNKKLIESQSNLPENQDAALKLVLQAIALSNLALDEKWGGQQVRLPDDYVESIINSLIEAITLAPSVEYLVASIQLLFRVGAIEHAIALIENNFSLLADVPVVFKILLLACIIEENYDYAFILAKRMSENSYLIGEDPLSLLMVVATIFKNGGYPSDYIDFTSLISRNISLPYEGYKWLLNKSQKNNRPTVLISCDVKYYHIHAVFLLYSLYETNKNTLDVHLHVYNIDDETHEDIKKRKLQFPELNISCTTETFDNVHGMNVHFASRRFVFASYFLSTTENPLLILDADCLVKNNWSLIEDTVDLSNDILITKDDSAPFWEKVFAGFVYLKHGEISATFINKVAQFIWDNLRKNHVVWFLDQVALSAAVDEIPAMKDFPRISTSLACDVNHRENSFAWVVTTVKDAKNRYLEYKNYLFEKYNNDDFNE
ncbi:conserved hypothetical protein [Dickeya chrysanthemi Ech1591]|uniref:Uncharacterized protein n=1 Tax=Dickeya chrysanthemi (strain Ech1591) TaxID=561229 RepID=C6CF89_DICC1|nr:hypothetical protein [Dickeya chrysanthemi]ACT06440.1 conserved hypothetical protein [Dickeya chrysanthemi Ech1591]